LFPAIASRKEQKEQARARRLEQERQATAKAQQNRRYLLFGGAVAVAVVVIAVAIIISSGGSNPTGLQRGHQASRTYAQVNQLLHGIPQQGVTLGNPNAPVTMTYFGDLQCPICRDFTLSSFPQFVQQQVRTGKVKVIYRSSCTATGCLGNAANQQTFNTQQVAAYAAGKQHLFWDYAELFYHEQGQEGTGYVNTAYLNHLARQIPKLNLNTWKTDQGDPSLLAQVQNDQQAANVQAPNGTPTLIMSGKKGSEQVPGGVPTYGQLAAAVQAVQ
jgi:protein-disulfide isomerase